MKVMALFYYAPNIGHRYGYTLSKENIAKREIIMEKITSFRDEYRFLSNFYQYPFAFNGLQYPNAEAAFQAQKCINDEDIIKYIQIKNPVRAKQMGKKEPGLRKDWDMISSDIMLEIERAKYAIPKLGEMLLSTGDAYLKESNHWHDNRWGHCTCDKCKNKTAQNLLGNILMQVRAELKIAHDADKKLDGSLSKENSTQDQNTEL